MTGRIRTVKPEFFQHEDLWHIEQELGPDYQGIVRLTFAGLWCQCDREGRFKWRPKTLKLACVPYDDVDFGRVLDSLVESGMLVKYDAEGVSYGCIPTFGEHQVVNNREKMSTIPPPDDAMSTSEPRVEDACLTPAKWKGRGSEGSRKGVGRSINSSEPERVVDASDSELMEQWSFPTVPGRYCDQTTWKVPKQVYDALCAAYPNVDVDSEITKAVSWCVANSGRRKTARGMPVFLHNWMERNQNRGSTNNQKQREESRFQPKTLGGGSDHEHEGV